MKLSRVERAVATGGLVDVTGLADRTVRAEALRHLLLQGQSVLRLKGARVTGALELDFAEVGVVSFEDCVFDDAVVLFSGRLRGVTFMRSRMTSLNVGNAVVDSSLVLIGSTFSGPVSMGGASVGGSVLLSGAVLENPGVSLDAVSVRVRRDVIAEDGFTSRGALRFERAEIDGMLSLAGAVLGGSETVDWAGLTVGGIDEREWDTRIAVSARDVRVRELVLLPAQRPGGLIDLRHAVVGTLRDHPETWPAEWRMRGLRYDNLVPDDCSVRLTWLSSGEPQPYAQLASFYREAGRDDDARTVLLTYERRRRRGVWRWWGYLQDVTIGYGYRPLRAVAWLCLLFAAGTVVFGLDPPRAVSADAPPLLTPVYTLDLIVPAVDLGQDSAYRPEGSTIWLAYALSAAGLVLTSTVAAAAARQLRRA